MSIALPILIIVLIRPSMSSPGIPSISSDILSSAISIVMVPLLIVIPLVLLHRVQVAEILLHVVHHFNSFGNPIDYEGRIDFYENTAHLCYEPAFDSTFAFIREMIKFNWHSVLNDMIRRDIQLWDKNQDITNTSLVFDLSRERVSFTVFYK